MSQVTHQITFKWWHESKEIKEPTESLLREEAVESVVSRFHALIKR